jgi:hypothetical protein
MTFDKGEFNTTVELHVLSHPCDGSLMQVHRKEI